MNHNAWRSRVARTIATQPLARGLLSESSSSRPRTRRVSFASPKLALKRRARPSKKTTLVVRAMLHDYISVTDFEGGGGKALLVTAPIPKGTVVWWENQDEEPDWVSVPRCRLYIDNLPAEARKIFEHYMYKARPSSDRFPSTRAARTGARIPWRDISASPSVSRERASAGCQCSASPASSIASTKAPRLHTRAPLLQRCKVKFFPTRVAPFLSIPCWLSRPAAEAVRTNVSQVS